MTSQDGAGSSQNEARSSSQIDTALTQAGSRVVHGPMPRSFHPTFIGKLIDLQPVYRDNVPVKERLCTAVQQCRKFNAGDQEKRDALWPYMVRTQQELAARGVVVG